MRPCLEKKNKRQIHFSWWLNVDNDKCQHSAMQLLKQDGHKTVLQLEDTSTVDPGDG